MRTLQAAFALVFAACATLATPTPALAQSQPVQASAYSPSHLAAARDMLQAFLIDTGTLETTSRVAFELMGHQFRAPIESSRMYASLPAERQQALSNYLRNVAPIVQEEAVRGAPIIIEQFAPRIAALLSEEHLRDVAAYMRSPEGAALTLRSVTDGVRSEAAGQRGHTERTEAEAAAEAAFNATPAGRAFNARGVELGAVMRDLGGASVGGPHIIERLQRDMCAILEDDCPPGWRS